MKKFMTKALAGVMTLALVSGSTVITNPQTASAKKVTVKKVTAVAPSGKTAYVAKGKKVKITTTVKVTPNKKANKKVTYKSANKKIATVNAKGVIKGFKAGKTKITVTSKKNKKKKATIKVVVKKSAVKKVKLNTKNFVLSAGGSKTVKATVTPKKNTCSKVVWSTSNKKVATVSSKGVVKGIKDGSAKITAKAADGSGKKASVTVTVGPGIANVSVVTSRLVRVTLTGKKALSAGNFVVQTKSGPSSTKYVTKTVENVTTADQKVYDVILQNRVYVRGYVKITIAALATNKSVETYVETISGYGDATNEEVTYETGNKDTMGIYDEDWSINNSNVVGDITYTNVSGLPSGLKAYISKDKTSVRVRGKINHVENGTTATLTGIDEKGKVFTNKYVFVIGANDCIVAVAEPASTQLSYRPDDPKTVKDEESGYYISTYGISNFVHVGGGKELDYAVTYNGKPLSEFIYDENHERVAVNAGTYNFDVVITDESNANVKATATVTLILQDGVTVSGSVRDASGQPIKQAYVSGYTKTNEYGRLNIMNAYTEADGTYTTRVLAGDYYTYCSFSDGDYNSYDLTVGNNFNENTTKNFTIPLYRVTFGLNVPGAVGYSSCNVRVIDAYGETTNIDTFYNQYDSERSMYAYLKAGSYEVLSYAEDSYSDTVRAYAKVDESADNYGNKVYSMSEQLGLFKVSGAFSVSGNGNVVLNAVKKNETEE